MLSLISSGALALPLMGLTPAAGSGWQVWQQIGVADSYSINNQIDGGSPAAMYGGPGENANSATFTAGTSYMQLPAAAGGSCSFMALVQAVINPTANNTSVVALGDSTISSTTLTSPAVAVTNATTLTITATHAFLPGQPVTLAGWSGTNVNGTYNIAAVNGTTSFTVTTSGASGTPTGGSVVSVVSGSHLAIVGVSTVPTMRASRAIAGSMVNASLIFSGSGAATNWNLLAVVFTSGVGWTLYNLTTGQSVSVSNAGTLTASGANLKVGSNFSTYTGQSNIAWAAETSAALALSDLQAIRTQLLGIMAALSTPITGF